jgi:hypothetical protein
MNIKKFKKAIMLGVIVITFTGCTESKINDYREQYIEACSEGNYTEAHKIIDKMKSLFNTSDSVGLLKFKEHQKYVYDAEISSLASDGSKEAANRVVFLMKQDGYCGMSAEKVLDLAINMNNDYLCERMIDSGAKVTIDNAKDAVQNGMSDALDKMLIANPAVIANKTVFDYIKSANSKERFVELMKLGASTGDEKVIETVKANGFEDLAKDLLKGQLEQEIQTIQKIDIPPRPAKYIKDEYDERQKCEQYQTALHNYNEKCRVVMVRAAESGLKQMANKAFEMIRPNIDWKHVGEWEEIVEHKKNPSCLPGALLVSDNRDDINNARNTLKNYK